MSEESILFAPDAMTMRRAAWLRAAIFMCAALLMFSRAPSRFLHPELWGEDGIEWLAHAYVDGLPALFLPHTGYFQTLPRLCAAIAVQFPLAWTPLIFALTAFCIELVPVGVLLSARARVLIPSQPLRLLIILIYVGAPNSNEVFVNLTNAMWYLAITAFLLTVLPKPARQAGRIADLAVLVMFALSGPFVVFMAPIACWHAFTGRKGGEFKSRLIYAAVECAGAMVQLTCVLLEPAQRYPSGLGASVNVFFHVLTDQLFMGGLIGAHAVNLLMVVPGWERMWPFAFICVCGLAILTLAFIKGPPAFRYFTLFAVMIAGSALASPMVATHDQWPDMQYGGIGSRYFLIPVLAWLVSLAILAARPWGRIGHSVMRGVLVFSLVGMVLDWRHSPYTQTDYRDVAAAFAHAAPGAVVVFPQNPPGWRFTLDKR